MADAILQCVSQQRNKEASDTSLCGHVWELAVKPCVICPNPQNASVSERELRIQEFMAPSPVFRP